MPRVEVREDESLEKALRRFKRMLEREGTLKALKAKKHYEKPSERKRRELRQAMSRRARSGRPPLRSARGGRSAGGSRRRSTR